MNSLRQEKVFLLLLPCIFSIKVTSTQEGLSYFFYQQPEYPRDCKEAADYCSSENLNDVYIIKPDGYPKPFEVYCNNDVKSGGWTVIHRQIDGSVTFKRNWEEYNSGFGFLSSEFWIGNDRLSYLTNQAVYELRIDMVLSNGSYFYVDYDSFRISDEWSDYALVSAEEFSGNSSCVVSICPSNLTHRGCSCQTLCRDSIRRTDCDDNCVETCVPEGYSVSDTSSFISNGESYVNSDCTENCTCIDNQLGCNPDYQCSPDATCTEKSGVRQCYCKDGYEGDGETCSRNASTNFADCYDAYQAGQRTSGIYNIRPIGWPGSSFEVFCNMTFGDGGWTVFQRRADGMTDFYRNWEEYKGGFGTLNLGNDFWLGNEQLHYLTDQKDYTLRIDFVNPDDLLFCEEYTTFKIGDESTKYRLSYGSYSDGNTGYRVLNYNNGGQFSTHDDDNDECTLHDCAKKHKGAWWYKPDTFDGCVQCYGDSNCGTFETRSDCYDICTGANLNGDYNGSNAENIFYDTDHGNVCNHKFAEMKLRPSSP